jgi:hypothetical protein
VKWPSRRRAALVGAVFLGTVPLWTLPLLAAGTSGFLTYLGLSHGYYGGARQVFGSDLFPAHEFGIVPQGVVGLVLAGGLYGLLGAAAGWGLVAGAERWGERRE